MDCVEKGIERAAGRIMTMNLLGSAVTCAFFPILAGVPGFAFDSSAAEAGGAPSINGQNSHDFGEILEGDTPSHTFNFTNDTDKALKILKVRVPCGCAEIKVSREDLPPGGETSFNVKFESRGLRGEIKKSLYLTTDSEKLPVARYEVRAKVKPVPMPIFVSQGNVNAGIMAPGESKKLSFEIENRGELELSVEKGSLSPALLIKTSLPAKIPPAGKLTFEMEYKSPSYEGHTTANLMLKTNDSKRKEHWVVIEANVRKGVEPAGISAKTPAPAPAQ